MTACIVRVCDCNCCNLCSVSTTDSPNVCSKKGNTKTPLPHVQQILSIPLIDTPHRCLILHPLSPMKTPINPSYDSSSSHHLTTSTHTLPLYVQHMSGPGHCQRHHHPTTVATLVVRATSQVTTSNHQTERATAVVYIIAETIQDTKKTLLKR